MIEGLTFAAEKLGMHAAVEALEVVAEYDARLDVTLELVMWTYEGLIDPLERAQDGARRGVLEPVLLFPARFGGRPIPENVTYVPLGIAKLKGEIDDNVIAPLVSEGKLNQYTATPEYRGNSFIPVRIRITATGQTRFDSLIKIWGEQAQDSG